jgi:hypothetical protein
MTAIRVSFVMAAEAGARVGSSARLKQGIEKTAAQANQKRGVMGHLGDR